MSREKQLSFKQTWWQSLELVVVSLILVQFQGSTSLLAKTITDDDSDRSPKPPNQKQPTLPMEPIRLSDEPVYIERTPERALTPERTLVTPAVPAPTIAPTTGALSDAGPLDPDRQNPERQTEPPSKADVPADVLPDVSVPASSPPDASIPGADSGDRSAEAGSSTDEPAPDDLLIADEPAMNRSVAERSSPLPAPLPGKVIRRSQQDLLADYQNKIHALVVDKGLKTSTENSDIRAEAKEETIAVLEQLDGDRRAALLKFLAESNLIDSQNPVISLAGADLTSAELNRANLSKLNLRDANLRDAKLSSANLSGTQLFRANLNQADLSFATLSNAELFRASLQDAKLFFANLSKANLTGADLRDGDLSLANLTEADLSNAEGSRVDLSFANLSQAKLLLANLNEADLSFANLKGASLKNADLTGAILRDADLSGADLSGANLAGADLTGAKLNGANVLGVDLSKATLSGTTLPDGTVKN